MQVCSCCVMDETDKDIVFNSDGMCNHCKEYDNLILQNNYDKDLLNIIISKIKKENQNKQYDILIGLSGGVDSSYVSLLAKQYGLKALLVHVDSGWNSELAVKNIENIVEKTGFDLYTVVIDWEEMKDLQLAFFKSNVPNCDIPQDHAFVAGVYKTAIKFDIKYMINGYNISTESILPKSWGHRYNDLTHIQDIQSKFGTKKLSKYPTMNFFEYNIYYQCIKDIKSIPILNFIDYSKEEAKQQLKNEFDWRDYEYKHYESKFTKFFQSYYLPKKFNIDKRKAHLSSLIVSNQMSRDEALKELEKSPYDKEDIKYDIEFVAKKLGISYNEFMNIINQNMKSHYDYKTNDALVKFKVKFDKYFFCMNFNKLRY